MYNLIQKILHRRLRKITKRDYNLKLLNNDEWHNKFARDGYVHLKNVLPPEIIKQILDVYKNISSNSNFESTSYFVNSVSFKSEDIKKYTRSKITDILTPTLNSFLHNNDIRFPVSVGFCINPANSTSGSRPHQDPNLVDETISYSMVLWISLKETNENNGCIHVLRGSHLWGNHIRSNFHTSWKFEEFLNDMLWNEMTPVPTQPGDIICFDPALIHGSTPNRTDKERIGVQISLIPKNEDLVSVVEEKGLFYSTAKYFNIDESYFTDEDVYKHPSDKFKIIKKEKIDYYYTKEDIKNMINQYKMN